jgi:type II secretory pathway component PulF
MAEVVFCVKCGTSNKRSSFKCSQCHVLLRPVYPTIVAVASLASLYGLWLLYYAGVLPTLAVILGSHGARFSPFVRIAIAMSQHFMGWGALFVVLALILLFCLGLFWQPHKSLGSNIVLTIALFKSVGALLVVLLSILDVVPYLTME